MNTFEEDSDDVQARIRANTFAGTGTGRSREEAKEMAFNNAWERAKAGGKAGKPLRVQAEYLSGNNPINWYRVILHDESG
jgi:hypothetical protein